MKFYTVLRDKDGTTVEPGIKVEESLFNPTAHAIVVGTSGEWGAQRDEIALCTKYSPLVDPDGWISSGKVATVTPKNRGEKRRYVRGEKTPGEDGDKVLVLISCEGDDWGDIPGMWSRHDGENDGPAEEVMLGTETRHVLGKKLQHYSEALVIMSLGSEVAIQFMGDVGNRYLLSFRNPSKGPEIVAADR